MTSSVPLSGGPVSLTELLRRQVEQRPDAPAVRHEERTLSYRELDARAERFAAALAADGIVPGDRVAFLAKNCLEFFEFLFGVARHGAIGMPLNFRLHPRESIEILNDAGARVLVAGPDHSDQLDEILAGVPGIQRGLAVGGTGERGYAAWRDRELPPAPVHERAEDEAVLLLYTSGTTGRPKGVMLADRNWNGTVRTHEAAYALKPDSVQLFVLPLFHIGGLLIAVLAVAAGAQTVLLSDADPARMIEAGQRYRVTHMSVVPVLLNALLNLLDTPEHSGADLGALETMLYGATSMPEVILRRAIARLGEVRFMSGYGMTETAASMTFMLPADHDLSDERVSARLPSVGRPGAESQVRVVDPETLDDLPAGKSGEILLRGPQTMLGYWRLPAETERALLPGGWFRTGDGGYLDEDGYLFLTDRIKDMIVSGGENIYPAEVEHALMALPGVREVAVIGVPDPRWGETPKAVVVGADLTEERVIGFCRERLARYKCPTSVSWADELPRTPSGKVMKHVLRARYGGR
jgi:acyl-CoA synthetase (AMP-forming)/AMP-acid ligase II